MTTYLSLKKCAAPPAKSNDLICTSRHGAEQSRQQPDRRGGELKLEPPELNAAGIAAVLNKHEVRYVVIGAFAAIAQQAPIPATRDIDFTPEASIDNLNRLSRAFRELGARIRTDAVEGGLQFDHDGASLGRAEMWNLVCERGEFDIAFHPAAFQAGYQALIPRAHRVKVADVTVYVADLDDVILSKESAGRPKDLQLLPALYRHSATRKSQQRP